MAYSGKVHFFFPFKANLTKRTKLKVFIERTFRKEGRVLRKLNYVFCSDKDLLRINRNYLRHDYYTDIITFDLSDDLSDQRNELIGEIYISVERVKDNARQMGVSFKEELHRVIFHGVLHLCGYGDKKKKLSIIMRQKEDDYLNEYFK